ncbi:MAG: hypothetical protein GX089_00935 [Fibrobacter sp.]|nr:hypothetical protein [Fibrobacter sp.]
MPNLAQQEEKGRVRDQLAAVSPGVPRSGKFSGTGYLSPFIRITKQSDEWNKNGEIKWYSVYTIPNDAGEEKPFVCPSEYFTKIEA